MNIRLLLKYVCVPLLSPVWAQASECVLLSGNAIPGGLLWGQVTADSRVRLEQTEVPVLPDGSFVIGLGRDVQAPLTLAIAEPGRASCSQTVVVTARAYKVDRVDGVPQKTVTPPPEDLARIAREREKTRAAKAQRILRPDLFAAAKAGFSWPAIGRISGVYGSQRVYNGTPGNPHYGVDVAVPTGTPVMAPAPGVVTLAEPDLYYSGGTVILDHGYGLSSSFLHMSRVDVRIGDELKTGDQIGAVGATGRATGPHLDWRMSWLNERVDPQLLVPAMPKGH